MWQQLSNVKWYMKCFIYRTADVKSSKPWSSQLWTQFVQLRKSQDLILYEHFIYHCTFMPDGLIRTHKWPSPNVRGFVAQLVRGFVAQLVRASHRYREVTGTNPVELLAFSGFYPRNCTKLKLSARIIDYMNSSTLRFELRAGLSPSMNSTSSILWWVSVFPDARMWKWFHMMLSSGYNIKGNG